MTKKKEAPERAVQIIKPHKYQVDVRCCDGLVDKCIIKTDDFREALATFDRLKARLEEFNHACEFDIVAWYVYTDIRQGEYVPVVFASIETTITEW